MIDAAEALRTAAEAVYRRFAEEFSDSVDPKFVLDNEVFEPEPDQIWMRCLVRGRREEQDTLGPEGFRRFRNYGTVIVQVFSPVNVGLGPAVTVAERVRRLFRGASFDGIDFVGGVSLRGMAPEAGKWYGVLVDAPFEFDLVA